MSPPGVSEQDFAAALQAFAAAIGPEWVFTSAADVALYRDAYSPFRDEAGERVASAAVAPDSVEQVREVVRIANRYRIPLYPISTAALPETIRALLAAHQLPAPAPRGFLGGGTV